MLDQSASAIEVIWYEGDTARAVPGELRFGVFQALLDRGYRVRRVVPGRAAGPAVGAAECLIVLGDFSGQAPEFEDAAGKRVLETRDICGLGVPEILDLVERIRGDRAMNQPHSAPNRPGKTWKPWFPVIDYERCTNCLQCLSFCLFDVYGMSEEHRIEVRNQDNCKTNCPACSRVCPEVAILFPKYGGGPINGAPVSEQDAAREKVKVDISALLGGNIYASLRERSAAAKSRFSMERSPDKALEERRKCLAKLQSSGLIPAEDLAEIDLNSLPSPEQIQQRARDAAARVEAARKAIEERGPQPTP